MDLSKLTPEQREELKKQFLAEEQQKELEVKEQRKAYKAMVNEAIPALFGELKQVSAALSTIKTKVYKELDALVKMKADLYDAKLDQYSHSFTTEEGITLIIGHRYNDGWDDTVGVGIQKVEAYIGSKGKDKNSKDLVKAVMQLLAKDQKTGILKASRVLTLRKMADEMGDADFIDAIQIIQDAYRPVKTKEFVTARYRGNNGETVDLPLDISAADFEPSNEAANDQEQATEAAA